MLEGNQKFLMTRIQARLEFHKKIECEICPKVVRRLEKTIENARKCFALYAGNQNFEIVENSKGYIVDLKSKTCSCRKWDLRGIPCCYGVFAILEGKSRPEDFLDKFYHKESFFKAYNHVIYPIPDMSTWVNTEGGVILPLIMRIAHGRPKKARRRGPDEAKNPNAIRKHGTPVKCGKCKQEGHNSRTCKVVPNPRLKRHQKG